MKITLERDALKSAMAAIERVVKRSDTVPILQCVKLEARGSRLTITGTDMDNSARTTLTVDVNEGGALAVDAAALGRMAGACISGSQIELTANDREVRAKSGGARFRLPILPVEDFPIRPDLAGATSFTLSVADFNFLLDHCAHAMSTEETRYWLNGIALLVDERGNLLRAVATDGHRLVIADLPATAEMAAAIGGRTSIISRITVAHARHLAPKEGDIGLRLGDNLVEFDLGAVTLTSKLIDATYPDFQRAIPRDNDNLATLDRDKLRALAGRITPFADEGKERSVRLAFKGAQMDMTAGSPNGANGSDSMAIEGFETPLSIAFQVKYLREAIENGAGTQMTMAFGDEVAPALLTFPQESRLRMVLMPIRMPASESAA